MIRVVDRYAVWPLVYPLKLMGLPTKQCFEITEEELFWFVMNYVEVMPYIVIVVMEDDEGWSVSLPETGRTNKSLGHPVSKVSGCFDD